MVTFNTIKNKKMNKSPLATTSSTTKISKKICDLLFYQIIIVVVVAKLTKNKEKATNQTILITVLNLHVYLYD